MSKRGFTLIELLVVIAIIALLLSIMLPSLKNAKLQASAIVCMSGQKQLQTAWHLYQAANDGQLVDAAPRRTQIFDENGATGAACFVLQPVDESGNPNSTILENEIRGIERGALWDYYEDIDLMHCSSDRRYHKKALLNSSNWGGYRSYSLGACYSIQSIQNKGSGTREGDYLTRKYSQIKRPSDTFVWIEEADGFGYNQNTFNIWITFGNPPNNPTFWDPVAVWHNGASTFSYVDGHADRYKWKEKTVIEAGEIGDKIFTFTTDIKDYEWFRDAYIPR